MKPDEKKRRPGLQRGFESLTQEDDTAKVAQVIKRLTGRGGAQTIPSETPPPSPLPVQQRSASQRSKAKATVANITPPIIDPIEANYYRVPNAVSDVLASLQSPTEQVVYHRLFRLAYGYRQNVCRVGMHALAKATNIASKKTIAKAISGLCETLLLDSGVLCDQYLNERTKQCFTSLADIVHKLEETQVEGQFLL
jgi:hypothetical protein